MNSTRLIGKARINKIKTPSKYAIKKNSALDVAISCFASGRPDVEFLWKDYNGNTIDKTSSSGFVNFF